MMMKLTALIIATFVSLSFTMSAASQDASISLSDLQGGWTSGSDALGGPAVSKMHWAPILSGQFHELDYNIQRKNKDGLTPLFSGKALYRRNKDGVLTAFWADSQGAMLPITAKTDGNALIAHWGNESSSKQGRTRYELTSTNTILVTDHILQNGKWVRFSNLEFTKVPQANTNK